MEAIKIGDKFVCGWGYDQTQYSVYSVLEIKGQSVIVEGMNSWSRIGDRDLTVGSIVQLYRYEAWDDLTEEERKEWEGRNFDRYGFNNMRNEEARAKAPELTIVKNGRINGDKWSYHWELSDGSEFNSTENYKTRPLVHIVKARTKRQVNLKYGSPNIRIDDVIFAHHETAEQYERNKPHYEDTMDYYAQEGRGH